MKTLAHSPATTQLTSVLSKINTHGDIPLFTNSLAADDAFDVKAKSPDAEVVLANTVFFQRVKLLASGMGSK